MAKFIKGLGIVVLLLLVGGDRHHRDDRMESVHRLKIASADRPEVCIHARTAEARRLSGGTCFRLHGLPHAV
jgi:hypothetical protein